MDLRKLGLNYCHGLDGICVGLDYIEILISLNCY